MHDATQTDKTQIKFLLIQTLTQKTDFLNIYTLEGIFQKISFLWIKTLFKCTKGNTLF